MGRITKRSYESCPIVDEFHIQNVLGGVEKRQWIIGSRVTLAAATKALTYTSLTGGLWDSIDHAQILLQKLAAGALPYITSKAVTGFTLNCGDAAGDFSVVILATLPNRPQAQAKWAKDYCPYCKNLNFNAVLGSSLRDIAVLTGVVLNGGAGTQAVKLSDLTLTTKGITGTGSAYPDADYVDGGSQKPSLVTEMTDNLYQIIITKSHDDFAAVTAMPYPSGIYEGGFTLNGDASKYYDILVVGQVQY